MKKLKTKELYVGLMLDFKTTSTSTVRNHKASMVYPPRFVLVKKNIFNHYINPFTKKEYFTFEQASSVFFNKNVHSVISNLIPLYIMDQKVAGKEKITYVDAERSLKRIQANSIKPSMKK